MRKKRSNIWQVFIPRLLNLTAASLARLHGHRSDIHIHLLGCRLLPFHPFPPRLVFLLKLPCLLFLGIAALLLQLRRQCLALRAEVHALIPVPKGLAGGRLPGDLLRILDLCEVVHGVGQLWHKGWCQVAGLHVSPVQGLEKCVAFDGPAVCDFGSTQSPSRALGQEPRNEVLRLFGEVYRVGDAASKHQRQDLVLVSIVEGRATGQHLIDKNSERPPVNHQPIRLSVDDLWSHVLGGTTNRGRLPRLEVFGEAKVC
mmetsp:Transcript_112902/g.268980  ORF Transcript_112902/g.268980 Transcript_112902/m.268980 type:complete len:257 (-) Transcript_112902:605-1375(-)